MRARASHVGLLLTLPAGCSAGRVGGGGDVDTDVDVDVDADGDTDTGPICEEP